jgi:hypothetical protein
MSVQVRAARKSASLENQMFPKCQHFIFFHSTGCFPRRTFGKNNSTKYNLFNYLGHFPEDEIKPHQNWTALQSSLPKRDIINCAFLENPRALSRMRSSGNWSNSNGTYPTQTTTLPSRNCPLVWMDVSIHFFSSGSVTLIGDFLEPKKEFWNFTFILTIPRKKSDSSLFVKSG